jgi:hypothetical protein
VALSGEARTPGVLQRSVRTEKGGASARHTAASGSSRWTYPLGLFGGYRIAVPEMLWLVAIADRTRDAHNTQA